MMYGNHMDAGGWALSVFVSLLLVVLVVLAIVWLVRSQSAGVSIRNQDGKGESAREYLDRRLVSGEIGEDEYQRLRQTLTDAPTRSQPPDEPAHAG
jgi:uncharacterized membrane protein